MHLVLRRYNSSPTHFLASTLLSSEPLPATTPAHDITSTTKNSKRTWNSSSSNEVSCFYFLHSQRPSHLPSSFYFLCASMTAVIAMRGATREVLWSRWPWWPWHGGMVATREGQTREYEFRESEARVSNWARESKARLHFLKESTSVFK